MKGILTSKSFIKLAVLTVLNALYASVSPVIELFVGISAFMMLIEVKDIAMLFAAILCLGIPILLGFLLVDRVKWWLISLPVQFAVGIAVMDVIGNYSGTSYGEIIRTALILISDQAAGVGIKLLWLKLKAKNAPNA